jgi:predicted alpha/beta superfamily hydrolase
VVVAIGYPLDYPTHQSLYDVKRRAFDLTPSKIKNTEGYDVGGGADQFLEFIGTDVRELVKLELEKRDAKIEREALFGHSFGGLCVVHAMFTRSLDISTFFACSPSIWWNDREILKEEEDFLNRTYEANDAKKPALYISFGSLEDDAKKMPGETNEEFEKRREATKKRAMCGNAREMYERLLKSGRLAGASITEFEDEDHGTVAPSALTRCISTFFEE